jgi:predicted CoA-binding protein
MVTGRVMMDTDTAIETFLSASTFAVAGASQNRAKYGNKVLRCYLQNGRTAIPINPGASEVEGQTAYPAISDIPNPVESLSIITSPPVTENIVDEAIKAGVKNIWMQPGAESPAAIAAAQSAGLNVIAGGPCLLVVLGYHESP